MRKPKTLKEPAVKGVLICAAALLLFSGSPAAAVELCAAIDGSGSLSELEFDLQLEGLASALEDPAAIPQNGTVVVSVVRFAEGAVLEIPATIIDSQSEADKVAGQVRALPYQWGHRTDIFSAILRCMEQFDDMADQWIMDISTDGRHSTTLGTDPLAARDLAVLEGLDVLNAIGVGEADMAFLADLVWPQPAASLPTPGFTVYVDSFQGLVEAMREKVQAEVRLPVPVDIKPGSCPNPLAPDSEGILPVAILGTAELDVLQIDPETVALEGVAPLRWEYEDIATPFGPSGAVSHCNSCTEDGPDGFLDLVLKFDRREATSFLGQAGDDECYLLTVTATLFEAFGGSGVRGSDVVRIDLKGRR
jgi:hypothetical protein